MREELKAYLAGIFDVRGFIKLRLKKYQYAVFFNFTKNELEIWKKIKEIMDLFTIAKIYKSKKRIKEYQLYIGNKKNIKNFLAAILPYSIRKNEILMMLKVIERKKTKNL